jgi:hypothetical protein
MARTSAGDSLTASGRRVRRFRVFAGAIRAASRVT